MSYLSLALEHASKGYFVFPVQSTKIPPLGFMDWEGQASRDTDVIRSWWEKYPQALPAIAPGKSGLAVIDADRHADSPDGFNSLRAEGFNFDAEGVTSGISLSGNGQHFWFRADVNSVNKILPGVDRKAQGGYVVVPYTLPPAENIQTPLPEKLSRGVQWSNVTRNQMSPEQLDEWLETLGGGPISEPMYSILATFEATGHSQMSRAIARVISYGARGASGASKTLEKMLDIWTEGNHSSGDPEGEFMINVRTAIEKFGAPVSQETADAFYALLQEEQTVRVSLPSLSQALAVYCDRLYPEWREDEEWVRVYRACEDALLAIVSVADVDVWRTRTKEIMSKMQERRNG